MSASDNHLLNQAASGDRHALVQLLEQHGPAVRRRIEGRIPRRWRSALSADDIMQQTYIDAFVDADRFVANGKGSFPKWLGSLAKCNLLDALKMLEADKRGKGRPRIELRTREDSFIALHELIGSAHSTPSQHVARDEACDALERAVALALPGGWIRPFVELGTAMFVLLSQLRSRGVASDYVARVLAAFPEPATDIAHPAPSPLVATAAAHDLSALLVEPLTNRELEVLELMAQRLTNKEIAARLVLSVGTVKQHAYNIYQKLQVKGRRQAVAKATYLGILSRS